MSSKGEVPKSSVKTKRRRRPPKHVDQDEENLPKNDALPLEDWTNDCGTNDDKGFLLLSRKIRKAEESVKIDVWRSNDALRTAVVRSSLGLGIGELDGSDSLLLLHDYESSLVKTSRTRVKEATEIKDEKEQYPRLLLATHSIRALVRFATKPATQEALLQLLYHIINTLGNGKSSDFADLILLAFEALYNILLRYKKVTCGAKISFDTVVREEVFVFPIPIDRKAIGTKDDSSLSIDKVCAIVIQATLLVSKSVMARHQRGKEFTLPDYLRRVHQQPLVVARHLLTAVATFWVHFQTSLTNNLKEGLSHCKRIHRLLWEQASNANDCPTECFELRQDSLCVLLIGNYPPLCKALECKFGETVCTYASKASTAFIAQVPSEAVSKRKIEHFHRKIGSELDRVFKDRAGFPYLEYCSLRAQQVGIEPFFLESSLEPDNKQMTAILKLALVSVQLNRVLVGTDELSLRFEKQANETVCEFRTSFLDDSSFDFGWSPEYISRISKILLVNSVHKSLYKSTQECDLSVSNMPALRLGAHVMVQCLGPFFLLAAREDKSERSELCERAIDCFLRGIAVFELEECHSGEKDKSADASKEVLDLSLHFHLFSNKTFPHFERLAKFLSSSARKREATGSFDATLSLQLIGLRLFTELSQAVETDLSRLMLSQRWACLSSFLESNGHPDASLLAGLVALIYDAAESTEDGEQGHNLEIDLFAFVCARSNGMLDLSQCLLPGRFDISDRRRGMILRIFRILGELDGSCLVSKNHSKATPLTLSSIFQCIDGIASANSNSTMNHVVTTGSVPFSLSGLLRVLLPSNKMFSRKLESDNSLVVAKFKLVLDILHEFGAALNSGVFSESKPYQDLLHCHKQLSHIAASLVGKLADESTTYELRPIIASAIYCVAARSIAPFGLAAGKFGKADIVDFDLDRDERQNSLMTTSSFLVRLAITSLSDCSSSDSQVLALCLKPILSYMEKEYVESNSTAPLAKSMQLAMQSFATLSNSDPSSPEVLGAHITTSFLSAQSEIFQANGEGFTALRLAEWSLRMAHALNRDDKRLLEVAYLRKLSPCTVLSDVNPSISIIDSPKPASLDIVEVQVNKMRHQIANMATNSIKEKLCSVLESRLKETKNLLHEPPRNLLVQICWLRGTLTEALAQCYSTRGDLEQAIFLCKECLRLGKQALITSTRQLSSFSRIRPSSLFELTIVQRLEERQIEILFSLASLFQGSGDYRRAETYLYSAVKYVDWNDLGAAFESTDGTPHLIERLYSVSLDKPRLTGFRRILLKFATDRSSQDQLAESFHLLQKTPYNETLKALSKDDGDLDFVLEGVARLRLNNVVGETNKRSQLWEEVQDALRTLRCQPELAGFAKLISGAILPFPQSDLDLFEAKRIWHDVDTKDDFRQEISLRRMCKSILDSQFVSRSQRCDALYILGLLYLREAREEGALARLWHGHSNHEGTRLQFEVECDNSLSDAKRCFSEALSLCGPASDHMTRNLLRSLALVSGPEEDPRLHMASWEMIHSSIGSSVRQRVRQSYFDETEGETATQPGSELCAVLRCLDLPFFSEERSNQVKSLIETLEKYLPHKWRTVAVALCPTGELLINSVEVCEDFDSRTVCIFPPDSSDVYGTMMQPLDELISLSQGQLRRESAQLSTNKESDVDRREWWSQRERVDNELDLLFRSVEKKWFGSSNAQAVLCSDVDSESGDQSELDDWANQKNYSTTSFDAVSPQKEGPAPSTMKVAEIRDELVDLGMFMKDLRKMRKSELVDLLTKERRTRLASSNKHTPIQRQPIRPGEGNSTEALSSTLLVLDEDLHRFPFEALPCLRERVVCRSPSISFVLAKLIELKHDGHSSGLCVDPRRSSFILDPESNLSATRERIGEFIESQSKNRNFEWNGLVGVAPNEDFFRENLFREKGMFLFFGHGGGQAYFPRSAVESLISPGERRVKASVILMGCSSGRLVSVNRKTLKSPRKVPLLFEPEGVALSYLAAGAPCVIGNLWDVTDRDIDRLSVDLLSRFYGGQDLATSLARARAICKMKYLNGYAPVYYGIPVFCAQQSFSEG